MFALALAAGWGILLGGINHWLIARPLSKGQQAPAGTDTDVHQAMMRRLYVRFLIRMLISLGGIGLAFVMWRDMIPLAATLGGLLAVNMLSLWQQRRRGSTV